VSRLVINTSMTADAVIDVSEWYVSEGEHDRAARDLFANAEAVLLGRKTYEGLAAYWSPRSDEWADMINPMAKYVASRTLRGQLDWHANVIDGDLAEGVSALKSELDRDLVGFGCGELARSLAAHGLVDEFRFWVHPAMWGHGTRPFEGDRTLRLDLVNATAFDSGVILMRYRPGAGS
jgi:dihydrofolate reductase